MPDGRTLIADWSRGVIVDEDGEVDQTFTHPMMNDVHEIQYTKNGWYLVASTGLDTLLVLDEDFTELWRWHMWEHLDPATRPGEYYPDQLWYKDGRDLALDPDDRYHLNYASVVSNRVGDEDGPILLCSALNYGIFLVSMETDEVLAEFRALDECHNPCPVDDGYAVAESGAHRVVAVDWEGRKRTLFDDGVGFVKDADPIGGTGEWLLTDTKRDRVLIWDLGDDDPKREFHLGDGAYPYEADYLTGEGSFS